MMYTNDFFSRIIHLEELSNYFQIVVALIETLPEKFKVFAELCGIASQ